MRYFIIAITILISGCGFKELKPINYFSISKPTNLTVYNSYNNSSVKVAYPLSLDRALDYNMAFEYIGGNSGYYQNSQWINPLNKLIRSNIIASLKKAKIFKDVLPIESSVLEDYRIEITVNSFKNIIQNNKSYALINLDISLIDMSSRSIIKRKTFKYKEPSATLNAKGYADAVNRAFKKLDKELILWLSR